MNVDVLVTEYVRVHGAHTIVLYGSRARGDATQESDIDVAAFADVVTMYRDARLWNGMFLDGFVYPTSVAEGEPEEELLKLCGGRIVHDERGLAERLMRRLEAFQQQPVAALPVTEIQARRVWAQKMMARIRRGDVEAHYRYHWLLCQLLEDHYALRAMRYPGPKRALADLESADPPTFVAFARALDPRAPLSAVEALVSHLLSVPDATRSSA